MEPAHSEEAQDVLLVTVGAVWEKEAFFVPGALVHLFLVLPRQSEQLGESRDQYECVPQYGQFLSWLFQSRFSYETCCFCWAYRGPFVLGPPLTGELSRPVLCSALKLLAQQQ